MQQHREYKKILATVLTINVFLVSLHEGEFWPFSIFPMFSQAAKPWSRGVIVEVNDTTRDDLWEKKQMHDIRVRIIPLEEYGIDEIDYANFISKTENWDDKRIKGLRDLLMFDNHPGKMWMAMRVTGRLIKKDSVIIEIIPMFLFVADSTYQNPDLISY